MDVKWEKVIYSVACRKRIFNSTADAIEELPKINYIPFLPWEPKKESE
jgi:hypothetical protein